MKRDGRVYGSAGARRAKFLFLSLALGLALPNAGTPGGMMPGRTQSPQSADLLDRILEKTKAYCHRLARVSLDFVCRERIEERQFDPPLRIFSNVGDSGRRHVTVVSLEYDYQLIRKEATVEEKRTLLKENDRSMNEPDAALKTKLYKHRYLVFGPIGLLSEYWQPRHAYTYLGEEELEGEKVYVIEAGPSGPPEPNLVYGKAWIRQKDFAIVKIEWDQRSLSNYDKILKMAETLGHQSKPRMSVVGFYGVEKNGIRFPDRMSVHEDYLSTRGTLRVSETMVRYEDYKYFIVETDVRYRP